MKKRTLVAKRTTTEIHISDMFYTKPDVILPWVQVKDKPLSWLRTQVQNYAGQHKISEDAIVLVFEQKTVTAEEQLEESRKEK
jgi:hypothetical protein